jgi:hypothetical protein
MPSRGGKRRLGDFMTKRKEWKTPVVTRLIAGAAESDNKGSIGDGQITPSGTNFRS